MSGPAAEAGGFGLSGIDSTRRGRLIVNHTEQGILALVDPSTGDSQEIPLSGPPLVPGTLDGLQLEGRTARVVQNFANSVARVERSPDLTSGRVVDVITSDLAPVSTVSPATAARSPWSTPGSTSGSPRPSVRGHLPALTSTWCRSTSRGSGDHQSPVERQGRRRSAAT